MSTRPNRDPVRRSRKIHLGFAILSAVVIATMIGGVVAMNAMLDQRAFRITALQRQVGDLNLRVRVLTEQAAALDAPARLDGWARSHGLATPSQPAVVLRGSPSSSSGSGGGA